jgi:hypothetical protein
LHCAGIEPATSRVGGEYSHHYATSRPSFILLFFDTINAMEHVSNPH